MIGIGFMTSPGIAKTSGLILSILIIIITGMCGVYGSFLIARGFYLFLKLSFFFFNLKFMQNTDLNRILHWSERF